MGNMDNNPDEDMNDLKEQSSEEEEEHSNTSQTLEHIDKCMKEQTGVVISQSKPFPNSEQWPLGDENCFSNSYRTSVERELTASSPDEDNLIVSPYDKTDRNTKDTLDMSLEEEKSIAASPVDLKETSLPVSLKIENKLPSSAEVNNNVDEIQPQFKELSLNSPTSRTTGKRNAKPESLLPIKCLRLYVEASYTFNSSFGPEIVSLSCEPIVESLVPTAGVPTPESVSSSGRLGDVSKTVSSLSGSPMTYIPPPPAHLTRMSCASSSSSSSFPSSAAALAFQHAAVDSSNLLQCISQYRINQLNKKWKNSRLIYRILDCIDRVLVEGTGTLSDAIPVTIESQIQTAKNLEVLQEETTPISSRKRQPSSEDGENPVSKRLRSASPIASTSFEDLLGAGVFAKWQNRKYYFAHIVDILADGRVQVTFLDRTIRIVTRDQIIIEMELLVGHKIMVTHDSDSDEYYPGIVTAFFLEEGLYKYSVATNNGDFDVTVGQVYFTEYQAKFIKQGTHPTPLLLDKGDVSGVGSLLAGCSGIQRTSGTSSETESKVSVELDAHVTGCDVETNDPQNLNSSVKLKNVQGKLPKRCNKNEDSLLGPLKFKGAWFKGLYFLITCSTHVASDSNEEVQTDSEDYPFTTVPFVYDRLVQQITLGGGQVLDKFEDVHPNKHSNTYLVTNRPCLTPKYLKCLAAGITIVCHEWIVNCTIKQKRLSLHELPAGWSIEKCCFVNTYERKTTRPLSGLRVKIAQHADQNFSKFWSDICKVVGASVSKFTGNFENTDVIVAEHGFKDPKLDNAIAFGIPVVSSSWIIQSVIHGEVRAFDGHSSYNHLLEETEEF